MSDHEHAEHEALIRKALATHGNIVLDAYEKGRKEVSDLRAKLADHERARLDLKKWANSFPGVNMGETHSLDYITVIAAKVTAKLAAVTAEKTRLVTVAGWAQAVLTALNTGDVQKDSSLHLKLREVMIEYRRLYYLERTARDI